MSVNSTVRPRPVAWPQQVNLPRNQASMSDLDWIRFIEKELVSAEKLTGVDRVLYKETRQSLLALRRYHHAAAGRPCPRWTSPTRR